MSQPRYLLLGEILRPHGVAGELRMRILTDHPERIVQLEQVFLGTDPNAETTTPYTVQHMRMHQGYGLLKLKGIDDRNAADRLRQLLVMVDFEHAIPLEEGEFYLFQLIGVRVETTAGETLGTITDVLETGANDVYVVDSPQYGEILIPVLEHTILKTDIAAGLVIVELPEGLLPDNKKR
jgi:16S rRNA processing protein RimM